MTGAVLLTGGTGFVGSRLLRALLDRGTAVVLAKRSTSDVSRVSDLLPRVTVIDVDRAPLEALFAGPPVRAVAHLATAFGRHGEPASTVVASNVSFPLRVLEHAHAHGVELFLDTGTFSSRHGALPGGLEFYALTKRHFREMGEAYARARGQRVVHAQLEHVYGPGDDSSKFVPWLVRTLLGGARRVELSSGVQRRDFVYVDDVVRAFLTLLDGHDRLPAPAACVEVGRGTSDALADLVREVHRACESDAVLAFGARASRAGEALESRADVAPLAALGWSATVTLREGVRRTVEAERARLGASAAVAAATVGVA